VRGRLDREDHPRRFRRDGQAPRRCRLRGAYRGLMSYSPHTVADRERMLAAIGVGSVDDLFVDIPAAVRATGFDLPAPLAEQEVRAELVRLAWLNRIPRVSFFVAGVDRHLFPAVVGEV